MRELHPFGAFAFLNEHIHGLVHISQFGSPKRMEKMLPIGEEFSFEITSITPAEHRMGLKFIQPNAQAKEPVKELKDEAPAAKKMVKPKAKAKTKKPAEKKVEKKEPKKVSEKKPKKPAVPKKTK